MKQQREILRKERETADKIAARAFAQSYLSDLVPSVFGTLADNGYFYDPVERGKFGMSTSSHLQVNIPRAVTISPPVIISL